MARVTLPELWEQGAGGQDLAHRHRVDPDGLLAIEVERQRQVAEALPQAADVFPIAHGLPCQVRRHDEEERDDEDAVEGVHRGQKVDYGVV